MVDNIYGQIDSFCEAGNDHMDAEDYDKAINAFASAYELLPLPKEEQDEYMWLCASIGDAYFEKKQYESSLNYFRDAYNTGEVDNPFILLRLGQCYYEANDQYNAAEFMLRAYMLEGEEIFDNSDVKYFDFLKSKVNL